MLGSCWSVLSFKTLILVPGMQWRRSGNRRLCCFGVCQSGSLNLWHYRFDLLDLGCRVHALHRCVIPKIVSRATWDVSISLLLGRNGSMTRCFSFG